MKKLENCPEKKNLKKKMQVRARQSPSIPKIFFGQYTVDKFQEKS